MRIKASGWPAKGHGKNVLNGLSKIELQADDHVQALILSAIYKLFDSVDEMDELDKFLLGMIMQHHTIKPVRGTKASEKKFDKLYKELRDKFEPPKDKK